MDQHLKNSVPRLFKYLFAVMFGIAMLLATLGQAQDPAQYGTPFSGVPNRMDANIYQLNFREYTSARTITAAKNNLQRIKDLGINVVYVMPFLTVTTDATKGGAKSPYSIKDFSNVDPGLGTLQDIRDFVAQCHTLGMAAIFDFVPNQTAWDHPWVTQHPDWYAKDANGAIRSPNAGTDAQPFLFTDVAEINLGNSAAATAMINAMRYWIFIANFDGVRVDWADKAGQAFNSNLVSNLRGITSHNLLLLAEGSNEGTSSGCNTCGDNQPGAHWAQGYDFIYGTNFYYNVMKKVWANGESATNLNGVTTGEYNGASSTQMVARLIASHDTYDQDNSPFSFMPGRNAVLGAFALAALHRGVPFIYNGIEVGNTNPLHYPWRDDNINWTQDLTVYTEMQKILNFRNGSNAIKRGQPTSYTTSSNNNVIAFTKINGSEKVVVMINVRNGQQSFTIPSAMAGTYKDAFTNANVTLTSGATQNLSAFQYIVLTNASVPTVSVTSVSVSPTSASVKAGLTTQLTATVSPSNATNQSVTWTSSNTGIATVSSTGLVTGVAPGTVTITVKTVDGNKTATSTITVTAASTFTVHFYRPSNWGTAIKIYWWAAQPSGALADGSWPGVAMTNEGSSTWYKYTFTNVTSTNLIFNDGSNQTADLNRGGTNGWYYNGAWYNSQPNTIPVTGVTVSPASATVNTTLQLTATVSPSNATNKNVSWSSSNTGVATVNSTGLVTAVSGGTATITVTTQDGNKTAACAVTVPSSGGTYYAIKNRWKGTYLYDAGANVAYGSTIANNNYKWQKVTIDANYFWLKNLGTGEYMNIEAQNGTVQCQPGNLDWWSQQWSQDYIDGTWVRFRNRWQTGNIIHVENQTGYAQYAGAQDGWWSAQWQLVSVSGRMSTDGEDETEETLPLSVDLFPNPSKEKQVTIHVEGLQRNETALVTLHDVNGKPALQTAIHESTTIEHNLPAGLYLVRVRTNKASVTRKLMVE